MMQPLPGIAMWAERAGFDVVPDEHEVRYYAEAGRVERKERSSGGLARLQTRDVSPAGPPVLLIAARDREDVARFLVFDFATSWLAESLSVLVPFGRIDGAVPSMTVDAEGDEVRVLEPGGAVRATFGHGDAALGRAARFVQLADLPLGELSDRLDRAGRAAAESLESGRPAGTRERVSWSVRRQRQIVV
jgi:hypothetical protein